MLHTWTHLECCSSRFANSNISEPLLWVFVSANLQRLWDRRSMTDHSAECGTWTMVDPARLLSELSHVPVFPQSFGLHCGFVVHISIWKWSGDGVIISEKFCNRVNHSSLCRLQIPGPQTMKSVPGPELEAGRACRAISGCPEPCGCGWWPGTCCGFGTDKPCWALPSGEEVGTSKGCCEGVEVGGRWRGRIFSAISCSLILLMSTRLSSWKG